ncbi:MAG: glycosyltransferase family 4 protein [Bacteroidetes bacterium]|nr:glycosyltransferase family 4 protein [Rhodothermia bacterium]MCS7155111.1 glycosyltransferase family 4 protein [Bacteroidota bacterium]MCX7907217.1 glycosyltransferase family 4 protein [Bacteroidota bacterium]MDW8138712.1 glycosyltransferase family 4 protein [Bacteroidota bacterium]MDW8286047.1 glycosyltransferase family 4 protein [Bacteroidota bacterium]
MSAESSTSVHLCFVNRYFYPDDSSTGQLLFELAAALARRGFSVTVWCGYPAYSARGRALSVPARETIEGVRIERIRATRLSKDRLGGRVLNDVTFFLAVLARLLRLRRAEHRRTLFLYGTNPPFLAWAGRLCQGLKPHRYVVQLHDAYPELAVRFGALPRGSALYRIWEAVNRSLYRGCRHTVVLCQAAERFLEERYPEVRGRTSVIPNWADGAFLRPIPKEANPFVREHGLERHFVLLYSGNLGLGYEYETLLEAMALLREDPAYLLLFIGEGGKRPALEAEVRRRGLENVRFLPYQPRSVLPYSLGAGDVSCVTIAPGVEGLSFPSKLYSALAVGSPVLVVAERGSELRRIVEEAGCGLAFDYGASAALAEAVRQLRAQPSWRAELGARARALFEARYTLEQAASAYAALFGRLARETEPEPHRSTVGLPVDAP